MEIYHSLEEYRQRSGQPESCIALGKFDGLHRGHQKLIRQVLETSERLGSQSVLFAIEVQKSGILSHAERARFLDEMGMDVLIECPFSRSFMEMKPQEFIEDILSGTLHAVYAAVGTDYRFGHDRAGDSSILSAFGPEYGYVTDIVEKERYLSEEISSTRVRDALAGGDMELADALLGRAYGISGTVRHGRQIGASIGTPTVNLMPPADKILPKDGVYASRTILPDGSVWNGITNIGYRPTVNGKHRTIETSLTDFSGDLYEQDITVYPVHFIRNEIRFRSLEELRDQIGKDRQAASEFAT